MEPARASVRAHVRRIGALAAVLTCAGAALGASAAPLVVPEAPDARAQIEAAERLIAREQWAEALPLLQQLLDEDRGGLVRDAGVLVPARRAVNARLAALPERARGTYELLYGPLARRAYERGAAERSLALLREVAARYRHTASGPRAASAAASLLMDRGEFGAALLTLGRAERNVAEPALSGALAAKKLVCLARLGRLDEARALARSLAGSGTQALTVGGTRMPVDEFLRNVLTSAPPPPAAPGAFAPQVLMPRVVDLPWSGRVEPLCASVPSTRPIAAGGRIFLKRDGAIVAVDRKTLRPLWASPPPEAPVELAGVLSGDPWRGKDYLLEHLPVGDLHHWRVYDNSGLATLSAADGRLFAVCVHPLRIELPLQLWEARPEELLLTNELRCYDAATGRVIWRVGGGRHGPEPLRRCWFFTAPALSGGRAYVLAARQGELRALCLRAADGELLWDAPLGMLAARQEVTRYAMEFFLYDAAPPAVADGTVVFPTGQGVLYGLDAHAGSTLWAAPYERAEVELARLGQALSVPTGPWAACRPIVEDELCLLAPTDGRDLLAIDLRSGRMRWKATFPHGVALLGIREGRVYVQARGLTCLDAATGEAVWRGGGEALWRGIGAIGAQHVYLPEQDGLRRFDRRSGAEAPLLRWPPGTETVGNLLVTHDALIVGSPERFTACVPAQEALAPADAEVEATGGAPLSVLRRGVLRAWSGDLEGAAADLDGAPEGADPAHAVESAKARLYRALSGPDPSLAALAYAELCERWGDLHAPAEHGTASLWTQLARTVREAAREEALRAAWREGMQRLIAEAAGDVARLERLAARAPFPEGRRAALLALGRLREEAGDGGAARRAYAQVLAEGGRNEPAAAGLHRLLGGGATAYARALTGELPPAGLDGRPAPMPAWTAPGLLMLPDGPVLPPAEGKALVLREDRLHCLDAATGRQEWSFEAPPQLEPKRTPHFVPALRPSPVVPGHPSYGAGAPALAVALATAVVGLDPASGTTLYQDRFDYAATSTVRRTPVDRMEIIRRARHGLPYPPPEPDARLVQFGGTAFSPLAACHMRRDGALTALDPVDGTVLVARRPTEPTELRGALMALSDRVCLARHERAALEVYDPASGLLMAEWRFPRAPFVLAMRATPSGRLVLCDYDGLTVLDLRRMEIVSRRLVAGGLRDLVYADDALAIARTLDGRTLALPLSGDGEPVELAGPAEPEIAWAGRSDGRALLLLEGERPVTPAPYGPEFHARGSGFTLRALDGPGGAALWTWRWPGEGEWVVGPPVRAGELYLLRGATQGRCLVIGLDRRTGQEAFRVEPPGRWGLRPVPMLLAGGHVLLGSGEGVIALPAGAAR